ncbi:MAG: hypothetical protein ABIJ45_04980 [Candidatus Zixiibacteriota bacterium]
MNRTVSRLGFLIFIFILFIISGGCIKEIDRPVKIDFTNYFPLNVDDWRQFSGPLGKSIVTAQTNEIYTFSYFDSLDQLIGWKDFVQCESGTYLKNIISISPDLPSVFYEPAFRFSPWSNIIGDTLFQTSTEISLDSNNSHLNVMVGYEIAEIGMVSCPAGTFPNCIKVEIDYTAPDETENKVYDGTTVWWFAPGIGVVKYEAFGTSGELLSAKIDGVSYP